MKRSDVLSKQSLEIFLRSAQKENPKYLSQQQEKHIDYR